VSAEDLCRLAEAAANSLTPLEAVERLQELRTAVDALERREIARALAAGESMSEVARSLGVTRQAAHRRFRYLAGGRPAATPQARLVLLYARREATALGTSVGPAHVLLGILRHRDERAVAALEGMGLTVEAARERLLARAARGGDARLLLADAARDAFRDGEQSLGVGHLLAACLRDAGVAAALGQSAAPARLSASA
jgi:transposase-like protein